MNSAARSMCLAVHLWQTHAQEALEEEAAAGKQVGDL